MLQNVLEKLQLNDEKNLLIQGLPSSIEKQFFRLTFAKNVTPLLRSRKIDFALVFAINENQLNSIVHEVLPALHNNAKFWVAYPKKTSKIATTLYRECSWNCITNFGYENIRQVPLDHVWTAIRFKKKDKNFETVEIFKPATSDIYISKVDISDHREKSLSPPDDFSKQLRRSKVASHFFDTLSQTNKKEYVSWIINAKKEATRTRRLESAIDKLIAGKKNPAEK
jgi:hypothetical protein